MPTLKNVAKPKEMITIALTAEQCAKAGIRSKSVEITTYIVDQGGNRRGKPITKLIPLPLRWLPGEEREVHPSILGIPKVQRAIARQKLRVVQSQSEVESPGELPKEPTPTKTKTRSKRRTTKKRGT